MNKAVQVIKEEGVKVFFSKWRKGIMSLTPEQLLTTEIYGYSGQILGTILAGIFFIFVYKTMWVIAVILFFSLFVQFSQLVERYQRLRALNAMKGELIFPEETEGGLNGL